MANIIEKIFRFDQRRLKKYEKQANQVLAFENTMASLTDEQLKAKTKYFREQLKNGKTLDDIKFEAFAVAREAAKRTLKEFPFKVQIIGSLVLHDGEIAEMKTGEGKTLTATMAVYLNALAGKGVHIVTVNEYLSSRDADWMGQIYRFLGLTVGCNLRELNPSQKRAAYECDITYTTNSELGFDYLRDNMAQTVERRVLRGLNFCIIDEADSILIDESRTPLIISGGNKTTPSQYTVADRFVKSLTAEDFAIDVKQKTCNLTESGNKKAEQMFSIRNLYDPENSDLVHRIHQALKANHIMARDVEYMVDDEKQIQLIDQFTGRVLKGREYSDGLQQAIQAKESVEIKTETVTLATITYQNFFRLYKKMAGMTGTAKTEEEEFQKIYNMRVVCIPTNRPVQRIDALDKIFATKQAKLEALVNEVVERHEKGQPILIGTVSVESSEEVSKLLEQKGLTFDVLNAKNHAKEAEIIAHSGEKGHITVATNMAGRGTDIKLGEGVRELGGLAVLGTERHESRRIDNQLRGRAGRQGDPGFSRFFISFDDELAVRFGNENMATRFKKLLGTEAIEFKMLSNFFTSAQKQIEGKNFDIRKNLLDYDDVLAKQRNSMYERRDKILFAENIGELVEELFKTTGKYLTNASINPESTEKLISAKLLKQNLEPRIVKEGSMNYDVFDEASPDEAGEDLGTILYKSYLLHRKTWGDVASEAEKQIVLTNTDRGWTKHIDTMASLREGIHLRSYANTNPLQDYVNEGWSLYREMLNTIAVETCRYLLNVEVRKKTDEEIAAEKAAMELAQKKAEAEKTDGGNK